MAIGAFIVFQVAMPVSYYLSDDPSDERFAWRMFSVTRMTQCSHNAQAIKPSGKETLNLREHLHVAWITNVARNRTRVIETYLDRVCEDGAEQVQVVNQCRSPGGATQTFTYSMVCETREFNRQVLP